MLITIVLDINGGVEMSVHLTVNVYIFFLPQHVYVILVTMVTAINLRKQFGPVNDDRADYQVLNKLLN